MTDLAGQILALAATDPGGALAWLDGGEGRGWFGLECDLGVEADSLAPLAEIEALWRAEPQFVWIGHLSYEVGVEALLGRPQRTGRLAGLCMRRYRAALELGPHPRMHGTAPAGARLRALLDGAVPKDMADQTWPLGPLRARWSAEVYRAKVQAAQALITAHRRPGSG